MLLGGCRSRRRLLIRRCYARFAEAGRMQGLEQNISVYASRPSVLKGILQHKNRRCNRVVFLSTSAPGLTGILRRRHLWPPFCRRSTKISRSRGTIFPENLQFTRLSVRFARGWKGRACRFEAHQKGDAFLSVAAFRWLG